MNVKSVTAYLFFNGDGAKAIELYERALGARTLDVKRFGEVPGGCEGAGPERILHAALQIGGGMVMISDTRPDMPAPGEGNVSVTLDFGDLESQRKAFEALAEGGNVQVALHDAFWGARFGVLTDVYGINWMFNCATANATA